jgi:hypothetical protein
VHRKWVPAAVPERAVMEVEQLPRIIIIGSGVASSCDCCTVAA